MDYPFQGMFVMSDADLRRHNRYTWMLIAFSALAIFFMAQNSRAQFTFATDNGGNSAYSDGWQSGDNGGSGFNAWTFNNGLNSGEFIGSPANNGMGTTGIGTTAFGVYGNQNGQYYNATRSLSAGLGIGDSFTFGWAMNWDTGASGLNKGIEFRSGSTNIFSINNSGTSSAITVNGVDTGFGYGTNPMFVTLTRTATGYSFSMTPDRDGTGSYSATISSNVTIDGFNIYGSGIDNNGNRNVYYNNFAKTNSGVFTQGGSVTNANTFSGTGALSIGNNTTLILSGGGNNNYTGATTISNGSTLVFAGSGTSQFASTIGGSGGNLVMSNSSGTVLINSNNSYTGNTTIAAGALVIGHANALGSAGTVTVNSGGSLRLSNNITFTRGITLSGDGGGGGALRNVSGGNTFSGAITNSSGARINSDSGTLTIGGNVTSGTQNFYIGGVGNVTINGTLDGTQTSGNGALYKDGSGTLTLTNNNTGLTGLVRLLGGTISITNNNSLGSGTLELGGLDTQAILLVGTNTSRSGGLLIQNNSTNSIISVASGSSFTLSGNISGGANNATKFGKAGGGSLLLSGTGSSYGGQIQVSDGTLVIGSNNGLSTNTTTANRGVDLGLDISDVSTSNNVTLLGSNNVTISNSIYVAPNTVGAVRTIGISGDGTNNFNNEIYLAGNLTVDAGSGSSNQVTISGNIVNTGGINKIGAGTLLLSGANSYTGQTTVSNGVIVLTNGAAMADAGILQLDNTSGVSAVFAQNETIGSLRGGGTSGGVVQILGGVTLSVAEASTQTYAGNISGNGRLVMSGAGQLNLSGTSSYNGTTTISSGSLEVQNAYALGSTNGSTEVTAGANLKLFGGGSGISYNSEALTLNGLGPAYADVGGHSGALRSVGGGNNTWNGSITLGSNSRINSDAAGGAGSLTIAGNIIGGNNVLFLGTKSSAVANLTISGSIDGGGGSQDNTTTSIYKDGSGTLTLSANNSYSGDTRIAAGNITVAAGGSLGIGSDVFISSGASLSVNTDTTVASVQETGNNNGGTASIGAGATLTINGNSYTNYMNSISGAGGLTKSGSGYMNLYGSQSYTGTTTVNGGTLATGANMSSTNFVVNEGTFSTDAADRLADTAAINIGSGTFNIGGSDTVASLIMTGGTLSGTGTMTATSAFGIQAGTISAGLGGSVGLNKTGSGTATLSGSNSYSGKTTISAGVLEVTKSVALGNGGVGNGVDVDSGARLRITANMTNNRAITVTGGTGYVEAAAGTTNTLNGTLSKNGSVLVLGGGGTHIVNGSITGANANSDLYVSNSTTTINSANSYNGPTFIVAGGTLNNGTNNALPTDTTLTLGQSGETSSTTNTYNLNGNSQTVTAVATAGSSIAVVTNSTGTGNLTLNSSVDKSISNLKMGGSGLTLTKSGANTVTLASGNNIGPGTIAIQQGTLLLGAANQIGDSTAITLSGGTLQTGGLGDAVGKLTVTGNSTIKGLNSTSGTAFTFSNIDLGNYSTDSGSTLTFLPTSGTYSQGTVIQLSSVAASSWLNYSETSLNNFAQKISFSDASLRAQINFGGGTSGTTLTVAAIPEPKVYAAAAVLTMLIGFAEYRRRRQRANNA